MIESTMGNMAVCSTPARKFETWLRGERCPKNPDRFHLIRMSIEGPLVGPPEVPGGYDGPTEWCDCGARP